MLNILYISLIKFDGNIFFFKPIIMKTRSYNFDHLIYQTGVQAGEYILLHFFAKKI